MMTIKSLRFECPQWEWNAHRVGFGYEYVGVRSGRTVRCYATATLCGPLEDDYETRWFVSEGSVTKPYALWWLCEASD